MSGKSVAVPSSDPAAVNQRAREFWARQSNEAQLAGALEPVSVTAQKSWVQFAAPEVDRRQLAREIVVAYRAAFDCVGWPPPGSSRTLKKALPSFLRQVIYLTYFYDGHRPVPNAFTAASPQRTRAQLAAIQKHAAALASAIADLNQPAVMLLSEVGFNRGDLARIIHER